MRELPPPVSYQQVGCDYNYKCNPSRDGNTLFYITGIAYVIFCVVTLVYVIFH